MLHITCHQENEIKTIVRYYYIPLKGAKIQNTDNTK